MSATNRGAVRIANDAYCTPDAVARACVATLRGRLDNYRVWEPHAGGGAFVRALIDEGANVTASDIDRGSRGVDEAPTGFVGDFLAYQPYTIGRPADPDWIIGNPPYAEAEAHVRHALKWTPNVAFLLRLAFLECAKRREFWRDHPPAEVHVLVNRPSFTGGGNDSTAYGWLVWREGATQTRLHWLDWRAS